MKEMVVLAAFTLIGLLFYSCENVSDDEGNVTGGLYVNGTTGNDSNNGLTPGTAFKTINKAAQEAQPGNIVIVAAGLYREHIKPVRGGTSESNRITYKANGKVIIKASEQIPAEHEDKAINWVNYGGNVWQVDIPDSFFEEPGKGGRGSGGWTNGTSNSAPSHYNPFRQRHWKDGGGDGNSYYTAGDVYMNDEAYKQQGSLSNVEGNAKTWFYSYSAGVTRIYANFGALDPNDPANLAEINVRRQNFAPDEWGLQYITVEGFTMMHAGNWYSDFPGQPERAQRGAISVYGGMGWIIQKNTIVNARSIAIDIGLGCDVWAGNPDHPPNAGKPLGKIQTRFDTESDKYGRHIVRNNYISRCGQGGVAGVFSWKSQILYNQIEDTNYRDEFSGAETGGIKLHYCNYGLIEGNYIRNLITGNGGGIWVDWGNQGIRVTRNIVINSPWPFYAEALHGPVLVDNNVFLGSNNMRTLDATGVVFANNLIATLNANGTIATSGSSINIVGQGRECYWFTPGTMTIGKNVNIPKQEFWWYNNIATRPIPSSNTSGYIITHTKENTVDNLQTSGFTYTAKSNTVSVSFTLNTASLNHVPATKSTIGMIMFPETSSNPQYIVGESIPADVTHDFFGKPYTAGVNTAGPFADVMNGVNNYTLWPVAGQEVPPAFVFN